MAADPERVRDLVFHLGLIVFPRRDLGRHLALVVGMAPSAVRGVEDHRDAQGGSGTGHASQSCPGSVWYRKGLESSGLGAEALQAYRQGIEAAKGKGDRQAEKEMTVFARRLEKKQDG